MRDFVLEKIQAIKPSGIRRFFDMAAFTKDAVALTIGEPDFDTPWHISEEAIYAIENGYTFYTPNAGLTTIREEVNSFLKRHYGLQYDLDEIIMTVGGSEAIDLSLRACVGTGDEVILTDPGYVSYEPCVLLTGATPVHYKLEERDLFKVIPDKLEKLITPKTKAILINYPNNPTGAIMGIDDLRKLAEVCIKHDLLVITDEIYSELTYPCKHHSIAEIPGMHERTLLINGFSKAYSMTGWRLGYLCGPREIMKHIYKIHQYGIMCASTLSQYAGIEALKNGDSDIEMMRNEYLKRRNYVVNRLNTMGLHTFCPEGAFYCFINISKFGLSSSDFALKLLSDAKVVLIPGDAFGEQGEGYLRLSYAYSIEKLELALDRLETFVNGLLTK